MPCLAVGLCRKPIGHACPWNLTQSILKLMLGLNLYNPLNVLWSIDETLASYLPPHFSWSQCHRHHSPLPTSLRHSVISITSIPFRPFVASILLSLHLSPPFILVLPWKLIAMKLSLRFGTLLTKNAFAQFDLIFSCCQSGFLRR